MAEPMDHDLNEYDSPDALMRFDDHILQTIFQHLDEKTLCDVANVCKRFRSIAEHAFHQHHHSIVLARNFERSTFRRILCKFGHLIESIDIFAERVGGQEQTDINAIIKHCTQLHTLYVRNGLVNCELAKPLVGQLIELHLISCTFVGSTRGMFERCTNLKALTFDQKYSGADFIVKSFPKLQHLLISNTSVKTLQELLALNPQLKTLETTCEPEDGLISAIAENLNELEELKFLREYSTKQTVQSTRGLMRLCELKKLKSLTIYLIKNGANETLTAPFLKALGQKNIAIEHLELFNFEIKADDIKSILKLKQLKMLSLHKIQPDTENDWILLATDLPLLSRLNLHFNNCSAAVNTIDVLMTMAFGGRHLKYLKLDGIRNLKIEIEQFEAILNAVQRNDINTKFTIEIVGCRHNTKFKVPESVQQAAAKHLKINYQPCIYCANFMST